MEIRESLLNSDSKTFFGMLQFTCNWLDREITTALWGASETFWEKEFELKMISVTDHQTVKDDIISKGEVYFTAQIPQKNSNPVVIRLSSNFAMLILHELFGSSGAQFKLIDMSELEIKILNSYCESLYKNFSHLLLSAQVTKKSLHKHSEYYNMTFYIRKKQGAKSAKIVVSIPKDRLNPEKIKLSQNFVFDDFIKMSTFVNIKAGTSKLALNDLKNLYPGDIILLENSDINKMEIKTAKINKEFKINPDLSLMVDLDEDEHDLGGDLMTDKNLWDDIQIEVSAEFKKIKMTLGELKQISSGLVVDLGSVFNNKISLFVENKPVAKGELVIINDKYGVKLDEVFAGNTQSAGSTQSQTTLKTAQIEEIPPTQEIKENLSTEEAEEFDYSDFENDEN